MNKVKIKFISFKLKGELIKENSTLTFSAINKNGELVSSSDYKGVKIISVYPDINTKVCDLQTQEISKLAFKYPTIQFISISTDDVDKIKEWCAAKGISNIDIWSDLTSGEFGNKTNAYIPKIKKLARGFLIMNDDFVEKVSFKEDMTEMPDFEMLESYLNKITV